MNDTCKRKIGVRLSGLYLVLVFLVCLSHPVQAKPNTVAKNVVLLIGDGMGVGAMEIARQLEYGKTGVLNMETLPHTALMRTYSADHDVTDSAAGGSAIATGVKTNNESLGVDHSGKEVDSILDAFRQSGKKTGLISTNMVTDATPAAFGASALNRWTGGADIARQLSHNRIDVILGGGARFFSPELQNGQDLILQFKKAGYRVARTQDELVSIGPSKKVLGLFHPTYMNFKLDKEEAQSQEPSLPVMTAKALDILSQGPNGFFLMAEGARIDSTEHAADFTGIWRETIEFDETVKLVSKWAKKRKDTLVVVLADHETMGISYSDSMDTKALKEINVSTEYMAKQLKIASDGTIDPNSVKKVFSNHAHLTLQDEEVQQFIENVKENRALVYPQHKVDWEIGSTIARHYKAGIIDSSVRAISPTGGHTANLIPVFAEGPGSEAFDGVLDNTDISKIITKAAKVPFTPGQHLK